MKRTPMRRRAPLRAKTKLRRSTPLERTASMAATERQRAAVAGRCCIVCGTDRRIDAAHLISRSMGVLCPSGAVLRSAVSCVRAGKWQDSLAVCWFVGSAVVDPSGWGRSVAACWLREPVGGSRRSRLRLGRRMRIGRWWMASSCRWRWRTSICASCGSGAGGR